MIGPIEFSKDAITGGLADSRGVIGINEGLIEQMEMLIGLALAQGNEENRKVGDDPFVIWCEGLSDFGVSV